MIMSQGLRMREISDVVERSNRNGMDTTLPPQPDTSLPPTILSTGRAALDQDVGRQPRRFEEDPSLEPVARLTLQRRLRQAIKIVGGKEVSGWAARSCPFRSDSNVPRHR